jgi:hypothetical protein
MIQREQRQDPDWVKGISPRRIVHEVDTQHQPAELLEFFKALAHAGRLKIVGVLSTGHLTLTQMAERLNMRPGDIAGHLSHLEAMGLVAKDGASYGFQPEAVEKIARSVLAQSRPRSSPERFDGDDYERKVLNDFIKVDGSLRDLPVQQKKLMVILRHLVMIFDLQERYNEKQVNEMLRRYHEDTAALRRYMVDTGLLRREKGIYWRVYPEG